MTCKNSVLQAEVADHFVQILRSTGLLLTHRIDFPDRIGYSIHCCRHLRGELCRILRRSCNLPHGGAYLLHGLIDLLARRGDVLGHAAEGLRIAAILLCHLDKILVLWCYHIVEETQDTLRVTGKAGKGILHRLNGLLNFFDSVCRLLGQLADFRSDDGETTARFTGTRRLDGSIEREQVDLLN